MNLRHACLSALAVMTFAFSSCSDDDDWNIVDGAEPVVELTTEHVMTVAGRSIQIAGTITDNDGISMINISCPELLLKKSINIIEIYGEPLVEYELDYAYKIQEDVQGESFNVKVDVIDVAGSVSNHEMLVTLDGDFTAPTFTAAPDKEITVLLKAAPVFKLNFSVSDNKAIDYVTVNMDGVDGFPVRLEGNGQNTIEYLKSIELPAELASYNVEIEAFDMIAQGDSARSTKVTSIVKVEELPDFDVIYLADVATAAELNSDVFGVPMAMDHIAPYKYRVRYYNENAGTEICFIPQKTDFGPICFGPDNENPSVLGDDPDAVGRITLDKAGVYYEIIVNTFDRTVEMDTYSPTSDRVYNPIKHMTYGANLLNTWWDWNVEDPWFQEWYFGPATGPGDILSRMEQDSKNPNIWYIDNWQLEEGETGFAVMNWHSHNWWNFTTWRVDNAADPSKCVYYGNYWPDNNWFTGNLDYFEAKYINADKDEYNFMYPNAGDFSVTKWGDEGYRKNFIGDNWVRANITSAGKYRLVMDVHSEHIKLLPM